jgi:hypothetical protein
MAFEYKYKKLYSIANYYTLYIDENEIDMTNLFKYLVALHL